MTTNDWPLNTTVVLAGNVPVSCPPALLPCAFWFAPCVVYFHVSEPGLFLLFRLQISHTTGTQGGAGGEGGGTKTGIVGGTVVVVTVWVVMVGGAVPGTQTSMPTTLSEHEIGLRY